MISSSYARDSLAAAEYQAVFLGFGDLARLVCRCQLDRDHVARSRLLIHRCPRRLFAHGSARSAHGRSRR
jgi:hypothetical protein